MTVAHLQGGHDDHFFDATQGLVYRIEEVPTQGGGLDRTELELEAEGTHHPLAERLDETKQGDGVHTAEWDAPEHMSSVDVRVGALEGSGEYHLGVSIVGTAARLSRDAILSRAVLLMLVRLAPG
eukprot:SAG11_NODE_5579_length_1518_cov_1.494715_3_plen_125_part_00